MAETDFEIKLVYDTKQKIIYHLEKSGKRINSDFNMYINDSSAKAFYIILPSICSAFCCRKALYIVPKAQKGILHWNHLLDKKLI